MKALSAAVAAVSVASGLAQGQIFAGLIHPAPSTYQEPILVSRAYTGMEAKQRMFQWYELVKGQGYQWRAAPGQTNIIFVRGCDLDFAIKTDSYDHFSDLMVICGKKQDGSHFLREVRCTTQPGFRKAGGRRGLGKVLPGQYFYQGYPEQHDGKFGALRLASWQKVYGVRDVNGDGVWSPNELKRHSEMKNINIHWVDGTSNREEVAGWSEGCFVVPMTRPEFLEQITPYFAQNKAETIPVSLVDAQRALPRLEALKASLHDGHHVPTREYFVIRPGNETEGWYLAGQRVDQISTRTARR